MTIAIPKWIRTFQALERQACKRGETLRLHVRKRDGAVVAVPMPMSISFSVRGN